MSRVLATVLCDLRVQWRNGFYWASAVVVVGSYLLLRWLPQDAIDLMLPIVILFNVLTNTFYFVAGLMLLESAEGTRAAQEVSPLRTGEYLLSKVATLGALSIIESVLLSLAVQGLHVPIVPLALGIALASALLTFIGVGFAARYASINEFLMPSIVVTTALGLPIVAWTGLADGWMFLWHPLLGPLELMGAHVVGLSAARFAYALVFPALCIVPAFFWARRALRPGRTS